MKKKLTALAIPSLPEGQYPDALMPGLILRVGIGGRLGSAAIARAASATPTGSAISRRWVWRRRARLPLPF